MERRANKQSLTVRDEDTAGNKLYGYAAVFDQESQDLGGFVERLDPHCFDDTLDGDIRALYNHDPSLILGRTKSGTLRLSVDDHGLAFECDLPTTGIGPYAREQVERKDIDGCSFGFIVLDDEIEMRSGDLLPLRTVRKVELIEISPCVCFPAYLQTQVDVRSVTDRLKVSPRLTRRKRNSMLRSIYL